MKSKTLFTKVVSMLLCAMMVIGCLPLAALANDWQSDIDVSDGITTPDESICDHKNTTEKTVEETCKAEGSITVTCNDCGEVISTTVIEQLVHTPGTCENCAIVLDPSQENILRAGTLYYAANNVSGMNVAFSGVISAKYGETTYEQEYVEIAGLTSGRGKPAIFIVDVAVPEEGEEVTATATFSFPIGHPQNPAALYTGISCATVAANDKYGYNYEWIATHTGEVTITMPADKGWAYQWNNVTTSVSGSIIFSDTADAVHTYAVTAGDKITLMVNSYDPESWSTPAAEIQFEVNYPAGGEANPYPLEVPGPTDLTAGTYYYSTMDCDGMIITVNGATSVIYNNETYEAVDGVITIADLSAGRGMPAVFIITAGENATATFNFAVGHPQNPATLVLGENTATVEANNWNGYNYVWTATEAGNIVITMPADSGWAYVWNNPTSGIYGDIINSDSTDVSHVYAVNVGDEITMMVNSYDPNSWDTPPASITFTVAYEATCDHTVIYADNGNGTHSGSCECGETVVTNEAHNTMDGDCVCGVARNANLAINLSAVNFEAYIGAQFRVYAPAARKYDSVYIQVVHNGEIINLTENLEAANNLFVYQHKMFAKQMTDVIYLTPYGVSDGVLTPGATMTWSLKERAIKFMDDYYYEGNTEEEQAKAEMAMALLKYGEEAQKYFTYNVDDLATTGIAQKYLDLLPANDPLIEDNSSITNNGLNSSYYNVLALDLGSQIALQLQYVLPTADMTLYEARVQFKGATYTIDGTDFLEGQGPRRKVVLIDMFAAKELREPIQITIYEKSSGNALSETYTTSVESVAYTKIGTSLESLAKAMMVYGDATENYFSK